MLGLFLLVAQAIAGIGIWLVLQHERDAYVRKWYREHPLDA